MNNLFSPRSKGPLTGMGFNSVGSGFAFFYSCAHPKLPLNNLWQGTKCCSFGAKGTKTMGYDCVNIPGAEKAGATKKMTGSNLCGRSNGLVTSSKSGSLVNAVTSNSKSICCKHGARRLLRHKRLKSQE